MIGNLAHFPETYRQFKKLSNLFGNHPGFPKTFQISKNLKYVIETFLVLNQTCFGTKGNVLAKNTFRITKTFRVAMLPRYQSISVPGPV